MLRKNLNKLIVFCIFLALVTVYGKQLGWLPYFVLLVTAIVVLPGCVLLTISKQNIPLILYGRDKRICYLDRSFSKILIFIWIGVIFSWLYGVLLGLINGVPINLAGRNFFGLTVYFFFPLLLFLRPTLRSLFVAVILAGGVQIVYGLIATYEKLLTPSLFIIYHNSVNSIRSLYSTGFVVIAPLFTISLAYFLFPKKFYTVPTDSLVINITKNIIFLFLTLFALIVPAMSKGMILMTIMLILFITIVPIYYLLQKKVIKKGYLFGFLAIIIFLSYLLINFSDVIVYSFSSDERSNLVRSVQYKYLVDDFTFWGSGLGAPLHSGYSRDKTGYGFELTYLNIIHKLGVFSAFLFLSYILTLLIAIVRILRCEYTFESVFVVGLMGYLVVGIGNPMLLSPISVLLHCIAMYILVSPLLTPLPVYSVKNASKGC